MTGKSETLDDLQMPLESFKTLTPSYRYFGGGSARPIRSKSEERQVTNHDHMVNVYSSRRRDVELQKKMLSHHNAQSAPRPNRIERKRTSILDCTDKT